MLIQMSEEYDIIELESFLVTPTLVSEQATKRREYQPLLPPVSGTIK